MKAELTICALIAALGASAELVEIADGTGEATFERTVLAELKVDDGLDLSPVWIVRKSGEIQLPYSGIGWGVDDEDATPGEVSLSYVRRNGGEGATIRSGLTDAGTCSWHTDTLPKNAYDVFHRVTVGGQDVADRTLHAAYSFIAHGDKPDDERVGRELRGVGSEPFAVGNDEENWWDLIEVGAETGMGIAADIGTSSFAFLGEGVGELRFSYQLEGAEVRVLVDGEEFVSLSPAAGFAACAVPLSGYAQHTVTLVATVGEGGTVIVRDVVWDEAESPLCMAEANNVRMDLTEGVRVISKRQDLMPFVYSSTNFTGMAGTDADSVSVVSVVEMAGTDEDLTKWEPIAGKRKVLKRATGEGCVAWGGHCGVWKASFDIQTAGGEIHVGDALFDMRTLKPLGLMVFVR